MLIVCPSSTPANPAPRHTTTHSHFGLRTSRFGLAPIRSCSPSFCILHSSFCLRCCEHPPCADSHIPARPRRGPGVSPMLIAKSPVFAALLQALLHSAFFLLHSLRTPREPNTAVRSANPTGPGVAGSAASLRRRYRHPAVRRSAIGCSSWRRRPGAPANTVGSVCADLWVWPKGAGAACCPACTTPSRRSGHFSERGQDIALRAREKGTRGSRAFAARHASAPPLAPGNLELLVLSSFVIRCSSLQPGSLGILLHRRHPFSPKPAG